MLTRNLVAILGTLACASCLHGPSFSELPFMARVSQRWLDEQAAAGIEVISLTGLLRSKLEIRSGCVVAVASSNPVLLIFQPTSCLLPCRGAWAVRDVASGVTIPFGVAVEGIGGGSVETDRS